jgi:Holliday junction resolvase-like predicted endonuclease
VSEKRIRAYRHGLFAETIAALLLRTKGHRILARRYKTPVGEIDLVALKGRRLAFVEVKQRRTIDDAGWALPARASPPNRQSRAILALEPSRLRRLRLSLRCGAGGAVGLAALYQERISRLTLDAVWRELPPRKPK